MCFFKPTTTTFKWQSFTDHLHHYRPGPFRCRAKENPSQLLHFMQLCSTYALLFWRLHAALCCRSIPAMLWGAVQLQHSHFTLFSSLSASRGSKLIPVSHRWAITGRWDSQRLICFKTLIQTTLQIAHCCLLSRSSQAASFRHGRCQKFFFFPEWGHATFGAVESHRPASSAAPCDFRESGLRDRNAADQQGSMQLKLWKKSPIKTYQRWFARRTSRDPQMSCMAAAVSLRSE